MQVPQLQQQNKWRQHKHNKVHNLAQAVIVQATAQTVQHRILEVLEIIIIQEIQDQVLTIVALVKIQDKVQDKIQDKATATLLTIVVQARQAQQDHNHLFQQAATVLCKILAQDKQVYNRAIAA